MTEEELNEDISWYNWARNSEGHTEKVKFHGTVREASKLPSFKIHIFVKNKQANYFQDNHNRSHSKHHVNIQIDYSENAAIVEQDEVQSAHWYHKQVTVFTAVVWTKEGTYSYCVTSDCLAHDIVQ